VDWLLLAALGIMWVAFLLPTDRRRHSAKASVEDFERRMELLAQTEAQEGPGRWIVTPRKGARFVGPAERHRARARERRRRVFVFLLESIGLTFLIGAVPPLRVVWVATGALLALLTAYVWFLVMIKHRAPQRPHERVAAAYPRPSARARVAAVAQRYVAEGHSTWARPTFNGLGCLGEGDTVHVVVRAAGDVGIARA
jgi:Flp pilus assembly protein TadB